MLNFFPFNRLASIYQKVFTARIVRPFSSAPAPVAVDKPSALNGVHSILVAPLSDVLEMLTDNFVVLGAVGTSLVLASLVIWQWRRRSQLDLTNIRDKSVFVTKCDVGIGHMLALQLDRIGCIVFAGCTTDEGAQKLTRTSSSRLRPVVFDIGDPEDVQKAVRTIFFSLGAKKLYALVNNAGVIGETGPIEWLHREAFVRTLEVNVIGAAELTRLLLAHIKVAKGRVINSASIAGKMALPNLSIFCTSKFAMQGFTDSLRREVKPWGVSVSTLESSLCRSVIADAEVIREHKRIAFNNLPLEIREWYGEAYFQGWIERYMTIIEQHAALDFSPVIEAYVHALFGVKPKSRYAIGSGGFLHRVTSLLPDYISDWVVIRAIGLPTPLGSLLTHALKKESTMEDAGRVGGALST